MKTAATAIAVGMVAIGCATSTASTGTEVTAISETGTTKLPEPQRSGGPSLFAMLQQRGSAPQATFPSGKLSYNDMSTVLWAASGKNRDGVKWTVPMAMGKPPYCKVYIATDEGAFLYNWDTHSLVTVTRDNIKPDIATQEFGQKAPATMVFVTDGEELAKYSNQAWAEEFGIMLVGAMSQDVYLASEALGIGARLIYMVDREKTASHLKIGPKDKVVCAMVLGKR